MATEVVDGRATLSVEKPDTPSYDDDSEEALRELRELILSEPSEEEASKLSSWNDLDIYLTELCSRGLDTLTREPNDLSQECRTLRAQLEDVSCSNYRALIQSFECAGAVRDGVSAIRSRLDDAMNDLPSLATKTLEFATNAANEETEREARLRTLSEHGHVLDLLEIPRLMGSLLSAELFDEALELYEITEKLSSVHQDDSLIRAICAEIDALVRQMVVQLLDILKGRVHLPSCLRVVGYLRRLGVFSELRLRMLFLSSRGEWMRSVLDTVTASNAQSKLVRLSDNTRAMMFEIITQYRAAFADDGEGGDDDGLSVKKKAHDERVKFGAFDAFERVESNAVLFEWTCVSIFHYLHRLEDGLRDVREGAVLESVLQQAMYCGQSLGRVGADFRSALVPIFENAMMRIFSSHLNAALRQFEMMIEEQRWAPVGSSSLRRNQFRNDSHSASGILLSSNGDAVNQEGGILSNSSTLDPPSAILDSPALSVFVNGILAGLNELRSCPMVALGRRVAEKLTKTLLLAADHVHAVGGPGGIFLKRADRAYFSSTQVSLRDLCVPHLARCLDHCVGLIGLVDVDEVRLQMRSIFGEDDGKVSANATRSDLLGKSTVTSRELEPASDSAEEAESVNVKEDSTEATVGVSSVQNKETVSDMDDLGAMEQRHAGDKLEPGVEVSSAESTETTPGKTEAMPLEAEVQSDSTERSIGCGDDRSFVV